MIIIENKQFDTNVTATITSCGRFDLLQKTIESFLMTSGTGVNIKIYDDSADKEEQQKIIQAYGDTLDLYLGEKRMGQAWALDFLYSKVDTYWLFHMEDDWEFLDTGYLQDSATILWNYPQIMVCGLAIRPEYFELEAATKPKYLHGIKVWDHSKWRISENHGWWYGWIGSPNLKRTSDVRSLPKFLSVPSEEDWDNTVWKGLVELGNKSVWLDKCYVTHIRYGRSLFPEGERG